MEEDFFYHAIEVDKDRCIGCAHCMKICPTEAIRIRDGKAIIQEERCIDCGRCYNVCPVGAYEIRQDDFEAIHNYKYRVALIPAVFFGQFPEHIPFAQVEAVLLEMGFTHVVEIESSVDFLQEEMQAYLNKNKGEKPLISPFCPAIVRLIQVRFPSLVDNIMLVKQPADVTALQVKYRLMKEGAEESEIGLFYVTPCAAKIAAIKSPVGEQISVFNGAINMDVVYNKVLSFLTKNEISKGDYTEGATLNSRGIMWSLTSGEVSNMEGRCLAVDGVKNVSEILERLEDGELDELDFLELRACDESCAGGILLNGNRFLTVERIKNQWLKCCGEDTMAENLTVEEQEILETIRLQHMALEPVKPRSMLKLDEDMGRALYKMQRLRNLMCFLPGIDCGACGAPSCQALAEDITKGSAALSDCIFMQRIMEVNKKLDPDHAFRIVEKIWGKDRLDKDCSKKGAKYESS